MGQELWRRLQDHNAQVLYRDAVDSALRPDGQLVPVDPVVGPAPGVDPWTALDLLPAVPGRSGSVSPASDAGSPGTPVPASPAQPPTVITTDRMSVTHGPGGQTTTTRERQVTVIPAPPGTGPAPAPSPARAPQSSAGGGMWVPGPNGRWVHDF